jgi:hypothetical protein
VFKTEFDRHFDKSLHGSLHGNLPSVDGKLIKLFAGYFSSHWAG